MPTVDTGICPCEKKQVENRFLLVRGLVPIIADAVRLEKRPRLVLKSVGRLSCTIKLEIRLGILGICNPVLCRPRATNQERGIRVNCVSKSKKIAEN